MPGVKAFRAMRVLRAVRLLRKSKSLRPIVEALLASAKPVAHSMVLLGLITSIYACMAVGLYGEDNEVLFGKLSRALFTMFQMSTGDGWSIVVRNLFGDEGIVQPVECLFFVSYMLLSSVVLINVGMSSRPQACCCCCCSMLLLHSMEVAATTSVINSSNHPNAIQQFPHPHHTYTLVPRPLALF